MTPSVERVKTQTNLAFAGYSEKEKLDIWAMPTTSFPKRENQSEMVLKASPMSSDVLDPTLSFQAGSSYINSMSMALPKSTVL